MRKPQLIIIAGALLAVAALASGLRSAVAQEASSTGVLRKNSADATF